MPVPLWQVHGKFHDLTIAHPKHEPWRSGVSAERRNSWEQLPAALCRDAATGRWFMESRRPNPSARALYFFGGRSPYRRIMSSL